MPHASCAQVISPLESLPLATAPTVTTPAAHKQIILAFERRVSDPGEDRFSKLSDLELNRAAVSSVA
jgi:hypothetical protein